MHAPCSQSVCVRLSYVMLQLGVWEIDLERFKRCVHWSINLFNHWGFHILQHVKSWSHGTDVAASIFESPYCEIHAVKFMHTLQWSWTKNQSLSLWAARASWAGFRADLDWSGRESEKGTDLNSYNPLTQCTGVDSINKHIRKLILQLRFVCT